MNKEHNEVHLYVRKRLYKAFRNSRSKFCIVDFGFIHVILSYFRSGTKQNEDFLFRV